MLFLLPTHRLKLDGLLFTRQLQGKERLIVGHVSNIVPPREQQTEHGNVSAHAHAKEVEHMISTFELDT